MINLKDQNDLFELLGSTLGKSISCFAVGGTAMMYFGLKNMTKDIDLVFLNYKDRQVFENTLLNLGFTPFNSLKVYIKDPKNLPIMLSKGEEFRFDLFVKKVVTFELTDRMMNRIIQRRAFEKLTLSIVSPEDIILLKCATQRDGDLFDAKSIMQLSSSLNWDIIVEEVISQADKVEYGPYRLHDFLSRLEEKHKVEIPIKTFDKLEKWMLSQKKESEFVNEKKRFPKPLQQPHDNMHSTTKRKREVYNLARIQKQNQNNQIRLHKSRQIRQTLKKTQVLNKFEFG